MRVDQPVLGKAAGVVADLAAASAQRADATQQLGQDVVDAVLECGFARHFVPAELGGTEGTFLDACRAVALVGQGCPSAAWLASLAATLSRIAGYLPEEGQRQIWASRPDVLIAGSLLPLGTATETGGGWRVSGSWPYVSSIEFAHWALVLARCTDTGHFRYFAAPRGSYVIERTWTSIGLRATGSHTVVLDGQVVPAELSFERDDLNQGTPVASQAASHALPLEAVGGLAFVPPILGAAQGVLREWTSLVETKFAAGRLPDAERAAFADALTRSAGEITAAELLVDNAAARADSGALTALRTAENARDCSMATDLLVAATERLVRTAGTAALTDGSAIQRLWRDIHAGASHIMLRFSRAANGYAEALYAARS
jgi:alkylation response protein AidB-like acyl-CoA dehydrogenase